jgi:hypothetical protein
VLKKRARAVEHQGQFSVSTRAFTRGNHRSVPQPDDSLRLFRAVMVAHGVSLVANGGGRLSRGQLMLFCPESCGANLVAKSRLIAIVHYRAQKVFIQHVLDHAEYDKGKWRE